MRINKDKSTHIPPYTVVLLDATDAYYYADIMGMWKEIDKLNDFNTAKALADSLFVQKNYKWKSLEEMNDCDGGFDVRIYDQNNSCVYAAHETFKEHWIDSSHLHSLHGKEAEGVYEGVDKKSPKHKSDKKTTLIDKLLSHKLGILFLIWLGVVLIANFYSITPFLEGKKTAFIPICTESDDHGCTEWGDGYTVNIQSNFFQSFRNATIICFVIIMWYCALLILDKTKTWIKDHLPSNLYWFLFKYENILGVFNGILNLALLILFILSIKYTIAYLT